MMIRIVPLVLAAALLAGCPARRSESVYTPEQTQQAQQVQFGTVEYVRTVTIAGTRSGVGAAAGAVLGGLGGKEVGGSGRGGDAAAVVGGVAGGVAGAKVEDVATQRTGLEITVRLENGRLIAVTQEADAQFREGDRVRVLTGGGVTRVTPAPSSKPR